MSALVPSATPLSRKRPPPAPVFRKSYWVTVSPSASLAVNRLDAAKLFPWLAARLDAFTTGRVFAILYSWKTRRTGGHRHDQPPLPMVMGSAIALRIDTASGGWRHSRRLS